MAFWGTNAASFVGVEISWVYELLENWADRNLMQIMVLITCTKGNHTFYTHYLKGKQYQETPVPKNLNI